MPRKKSDMTPEEKKLLDEHRKRLRKRFLTQDNDYMNDARLLELLLTFAIPQKDLYVTAVRLLAKFGDIEGVLSASYDDLCSVNGIGEKSALLIKVVPALSRRCVIAKNNRKNFKNADEVGEKICELFYGIKEERFLVLSFNSSMNLIGHEWLSYGTSDECQIDVEAMMRVMLRENVAFVALAHNHPNGKLTPSAQDIRASLEINRLMRPLSPKLVDMYIVSDDKFYKMSEAMHYVGEVKRLNDDEYSYAFDDGFDALDAAEMAEILLERESEI